MATRTVAKSEYMAFHSKMNSSCDIVGSGAAFLRRGITVLDFGFMAFNR
jgi:hypothetical protein